MEQTRNWPPVDVAGHRIAPGEPALIVGEVAQAHDGSLGIAHAFIDAIADAGADAVKFQTHIAAEESTPAEPFRVKFSKQDETRYDYWKRMEFTEAQWQGLADHARERGLIFLSSPFSRAAVELLHRVGVPAWKMASGELTNPDLFEAVLDTGLPVLLSTGMGELTEVDRAVEWVAAADLPLVLFQCTSMYPTPPERVGLNLLDLYRRRYNCPVGLSDHSGTIYPALAAAAVGVEAVEVHVTLSRDMFGPDVVASVTPAELRSLVEGVRAVETMRSSPVEKDAMAEQLAPVRQLFTRSVVAARALEQGTELARRDLAVKKPGGGIPPDALPGLYGRRLLRDVRKDEPLKDDDVSAE